MKCKNVYRHICDNLDQHMNSPQCREIKKHLQACPDCTAYLDSLKKTVSLYRAADAPQLPKKTHDHLFKTIDLAWLGTTKKGRKAKRFSR